MTTKCLLCHSEKLEKREITVKPQGTYWVCGSCEYIFRDPGERIAPAEEKARYETHNNDDSPGYRRFLGPVVEGILKFAEPGKGLHGLDYGCGPTGFLSKFFAEKDVELIQYDPFFFPNEKVFEHKYDFVTSTEVFEHMFDPRKEMARIDAVLNPQGLLAVKTSMPPAFEIFKTWSYRRDSTHVGFFSRKSFHYIAHHWNYEILEEKDNLWILRKSVPGT